MKHLSLSLAAVGLALGACRPAATPAPPPAPAPAAAPNAARGGGAPTPGMAARGGGAGGQGGGQAAAGAQDPQPRAFGQVITSAAHTKRGVFNVHQVSSRLYFEIPKSEWNKDYIIVSTLAGTPSGIGINGTMGGNDLVRFERRDNRILLRQASYSDIISDTATSAASRLAYDLIGFTRIIAAFNIEAYGPDSSAVIEVTRMFVGQIPEFLALGQRAQVDASRSFIDRFAAYSRNVNVTATQTFTPQAAAGAAAAGGRGQGAGQAGPTSQRFTFSIVKLPDDQMMPRLADPRVGYFNVRQRDFAAITHRVENLQYISKWRLECSDQKVGNLCVPKKPITYYLDPATPAWIKPWIKRGIEAWQPAFEEAGFSKGIIAAEPPTNDPDFSGEDATVSMVRWLPSATENAVGPSLKDPRTGEILDADVQTYLNVMNLSRDWYFTQVSPLDKRAQKLPFPDSLMGRLVEYVTAHEVGHTLGFQHNFKASSMYPLDSLRSKTFVKKMGHTPTLMDYARFNYVAQPEDGIDVEDLIPKVGPYDHYAVMWGYTPIPGAKTPQDEKPTLDKWSKLQDDTPWFRFSGNSGSVDPGEQSEAVGDADAVRATTLGVKNLKRVMGYLESASAWKEGDSFADLNELYGRTVGQWSTEMNHITRIVGGVNIQEKMVGQAGPRYTPVDPRRQREAVKYLNENAFTTQSWLLDRNILSKLEPTGSLNRFGGAQTRVLNSLLANDKLNRMLEVEATARSRSEVYPLAEMLADVRNGIWSEIRTGASIDLFRQNLQSSWLESMNTKINPPAAAAGAAQQGGRGGGAGGTTGIRAILKAELRTLDSQLAGAIPRTSDTMSKAHLQDSRDVIRKILNESTGSSN